MIKKNVTTCKLQNIFCSLMPHICHSPIKTFLFLVTALGCSRKDPYPPPTEEIGNNPPPPLWTSYTNLRHFLDNPYLPLSRWRKFPLWMGYGSFLEQPIILSCVCWCAKEAKINVN